MKALRFHGRKDLRVDDVDDPASCGPHQVLVKNSYCGICGTDLHEYLHGPIQIPQKPHPFSKAVAPLILGHEFSGVVEKVGSEVQNVRPGDHVSIQPNVIPGGDYSDRRGRSHLSANLSVVGLSYPCGGLAERCLVYDYNVAKLPSEVSYEQGAIIEPAAVAVNAIGNGGLYHLPIVISEKRIGRRRWAGPPGRQSAPRLTAGPTLGAFWPGSPKNSRLLDVTRAARLG